MMKTGDRRTDATDSLMLRVKNTFRFVTIVYFRYWFWYYICIVPLPFAFRSYNLSHYSYIQAFSDLSFHNRLWLIRVHLTYSFNEQVQQILNLENPKVIVEVKLMNIDQHQNMKMSRHHVGFSQRKRNEPPDHQVWFFSSEENLNKTHLSFLFILIGFSLLKILLVSRHGKTSHHHFL